MSERTSLKRGQLGTTALVFMIIAASAPLTVLAGGAPTNFAVSGLLGLPLSYLVLGVILILFSVGYAAMSSRIHNAGAFYAYISQGLGPRQGIAAALLALVSYNMLQAGLYGLFGFSLSAAIFTWTAVQLPWWLVGAIGWLLVALLGVSNVDFSAKILGVLVTLEFLVVLIVMGYALFNAPEGLSTVTLRPNDFMAPGVGVLLAFSIAAFMGFESGAIYSEETKDPKRTVARATYIAVAVIAVFYGISTWALAMGIGPSSIIGEAQQYGPDLVFVWLSQYSPLLADVAHLLFVTSIFAALLAFHNAAARYFFALGRSRVLPGSLGRLGRNGAPVAGSLAQSVVGAGTVVVFALAGINSELGELFPVITLFTWFSTAAAFGLVFLMALTSIAVLAWFRKDHHGFGVFTRIIAPSVAAVAMIIVAILILINFDIMIGEDSPRMMVFIMPGIILGTGVLGALWSLRFDRHTDIHTIADDDSLPVRESDPARITTP
ncbi:Putrescine importer PuuP [Corynebacterium occultum]|uniref:Putrescine importer PuuP n=1 Tax=Corynebacterium occultum TaxID=2675219 RepID=A0A6B8W3K4_9CORY|nr:APC family permease [Corynebacterium occultum]QGU05985.1 Putrescine importer PuuP [Corynebacterium occultum]